MAQKNTRDHEKDFFEVHECPNCHVEDEFNMCYDNFLCRNCGKVTTADIKMSLKAKKS